jgi:hypothetical protein
MQRIHFSACAIAVAAAFSSGSSMAALTVSFKAPSSGAKLSGQVKPANCAVGGSSIDRVDFYVVSASGTSTLVSSDENSGYNCSFDSTRFTDGSYTLRAVAFDSRKASVTANRPISIVNGNTGGSTPPPPTPTPTPTPSYSGTPYTGTPIALPKAFPAADFDKGGQNVAYRDLTTGNQGGQYRTGDSVDIAATRDTQSPVGAYDIINFQTGEWLAYTVNVPANGNYDIAIRAANNYSSPTSFHVEVDGVNVTGTLSVPKTNSWSSYTWVGKQGIPLVAGKRVLKVVADAQYFSLNGVSVLGQASAPVNQPPTVSFKAPTAGAKLTGYVNSNTCEADATDDSKVQRVEFSMGGQPLNAPTAAPWQCAIDTTAFQPGSYKLQAKAFDDKGLSTTATVDVTVDNPPVVPPAAPDFSCSFEDGFAACGLMEQAKVSGRASIVGTARDLVKGVRLNTQPGDNNVNGSESWERNDLSLGRLSADSLGYCKAGMEEWWSTSILFPEDFVFPPSGIYTLWDFHHSGSTGPQNFAIQAVAGLGLRTRGYGGGTVGGGQYNATVPDPYGAVKNVVKNRWYDFVLHVKWSPNGDGVMEGWINGQKFLAHSGPTLYAGQTCYLKLANYHAAWGVPSSVIHDRVKRGKTWNAVSDTPLQGVQ